jgi:hypothetical protein
MYRHDACHGADTRALYILGLCGIEASHYAFRRAAKPTLNSKIASLLPSSRLIGCDGLRRLRLGRSNRATGVHRQNFRLLSGPRAGRGGAPTTPSIGCFGLPPDPSRPSHRSDGDSTRCLASSHPQAPTLIGRTLDARRLQASISTPRRPWHAPHLPASPFVVEIYQNEGQDSAAACPWSTNIDGLLLDSTLSRPPRQNDSRLLADDMIPHPEMHTRIWLASRISPDRAGLMPRVCPLRGLGP